VNLSDVARLRLRNQRIAVAGFGSAEEVVGWLGAVQSQEYALARWSVGMRMTGRGGAPAVESEVERAIAEGRVLRTHILRPTWHFVLPRDIRPVMRLTAPRIRVFSARRDEQLGLDARQLAAAYDLISAALEGERHLTRPELGGVLERGGISPEGQRLAYILIGAEMELLVASGEPSGTKQTYALLDERAPEGRNEPFERDRALADLARRYFTGHGPATIADFTWWSSLSTADARRGLAANGSALERLEVDGTDYWWAGDTARGPDDPSPTAHLLQGFDEYVVGYRSPRTVVNLAGLGPHTALGVPSWLHGVFLDGQLVGWWRRAAAKEGARVETKLFRGLSIREQSALRHAVGRYADFAGSTTSPHSE
jgi:hypothetical protein